MLCNAQEPDQMAMESRNDDASYPTYARSPRTLQSDSTSAYPVLSNHLSQAGRMYLG